MPEVALSGVDEWQADLADDSGTWLPENQMCQVSPWDPESMGLIVCY